MQSDLEVLEEELYALAADLPASVWYTSTYRDFKKLLEIRADNPERLEAALNYIQSRVEGAWQAYSRTPVGKEERTAEAVVGHKLLVEGLAGWLEALELCRQGASDKTVLEAMPMK